MKKSAFAFLRFAFTLIGIVILLSGLNWIPGTIQKDTLRRYDSIEQIRSKLNIRTIYIPSYFPQDIAWPPSRIFAQRSPFEAIILEFRRAGTDQPALVLSQSRAGAIGTGNPLELTSITQTAPFLLRGLPAMLTVGECGNRGVCSRIAWDEEGYSITAVMQSPPFELSKIVESMHP